MNRGARVDVDGQMVRSKSRDGKYFWDGWEYGRGSDIAIK